MSIPDKVVEATTSSPKEGEMNAIDLLKKDHDDVDALFKDWEKLAKDGGDAGERRSISTEIYGMLAEHEMIEEEIFHPAARKANVDADLLDEADIERGSAKQLIADIGASKASDSHYDARVRMLGEYIRQHVKEEEG